MKNGARQPTAALPFEWKRILQCRRQLILKRPLESRPRYIANSAYGAPTPFFGLFELPGIVGKNEELATRLFTLHRWVGWLVVLLVLTHVSAALYHHFIRRDAVLKRMLPRALGGF